MEASVFGRDDVNVCCEDDNDDEEDAAIDAMIQQEERLIRIYEAELALLQTASNSKKTNKKNNNDDSELKFNNERDALFAAAQEANNDTNCDDHALDWILHLNSGTIQSHSRNDDDGLTVVAAAAAAMSNVLQQNATASRHGVANDGVGVVANSITNDAATTDIFHMAPKRPAWLDRLQPTLRNFVFTSFSTLPRRRFSAVEQQQQKPQQMPERRRRYREYELTGHFLVNPQVRAVIHLVVELPTEHNVTTKSTSTSTSTIVSSPTLHSLTCELQDDWKWLQQHLPISSSPQKTTNPLPEFLRSVNEYLEFDVERQRYLATTLLSPPLPSPLASILAAARPKDHGRTSSRTGGTTTGSTRPCPSCGATLLVAVEPIEHGSKVLVHIPIRSYHYHRHPDHGDTKNRTTGANNSNSNCPESKLVADRTTTTSTVSSVSGTTTPGRTLTLSWEWRFVERRAQLRLRRRLPGYDNTDDNLDNDDGNDDGAMIAAFLRQADLDQLVEACRRDCGRALTVLLAVCAAGCCDGGGGNTPKNDNDDHRTEATFLRPRTTQAAGLDHHFSTGTRSALEAAFWHDADDEADEEDNQENNEEGDEPFRYSPQSGRRRSDYEVQRLERICRNEQRLNDLGLLQPLLSEYLEDERQRQTPPPPISLSKTDDVHRSKKRRALVETSSIDVGISSLQHHRPTNGGKRPRYSTTASKQQTPKSIENAALPNEEEEEESKAIDRANHLASNAADAPVPLPKIEKLTSTEKSLHTFKSVPRTTPSSLSSDADRVRQRFKELGCTITGDGGIVPKKTPVRNDNDTTYKRPRGTAPRGFAWDGARGVWREAVPN